MGKFELKRVTIRTKVEKHSSLFTCVYMYSVNSYNISILFLLFMVCGCECGCVYFCVR